MKKTEGGRKHWHPRKKHNRGATHFKKIRNPDGSPRRKKIQKV